MVPDMFPKMGDPQSSPWVSICLNMFQYVSILKWSNDLDDLGGAPMTKETSI